MQEDSVKEVKSRSFMSGWIFKLIVLVLVIAIGFVGWKYFGAKDTQTPVSPAQSQSSGDPATDKAAQAEMEKATAELLASVGQLILLPDEKPNFATILDAKKLIAEQPFYAGSENGDQLIIYPKAQKAIIYSPTKKILVNVGPVYFNNATETPATKK